MRTALTQPAATSSCCPVNCLRDLTLGIGKQFCASLTTNLVRLLVGKPGPLKLWAESLTVFFFIQVTLCPGKFKIFPLALIGSPDLRRLEVDVRLVAPFDSHLAVNCHLNGPPNPWRQLINGRRLSLIDSGPYLEGPSDGA